MQDNKHSDSFDVGLQLSRNDVFTLIRNLSEAVLSTNEDLIQLSIGMDYLHFKGEQYKVVISTIQSMIEISKVDAIIGGRVVCEQTEEGAI